MSIKVLSKIDLRPRGGQRITDAAVRLDDPVGDEGTALLVDFRPVFDYTGPDGPKSSLGRALVEVTGTSTYAADMEAASPPPVGFRNEHRIKNDPGEARVLAPAWSIISQPGYQADGATVQLRDNEIGFEQVDYWAEPFYLTLNGGVIDGVTLGVFTSKSFSAGIHAHGNVWIDGWTGYEVRAPTLTESLPDFDDAPGVINNLVGIDVAPMVDGAVSNRAIRLGAGGIEFAAATEPTGALTADAEALVYFSPGGSLVLKYDDAGTVRYKSLDLAGTGVTWAHSTSPPA